MPNGVEVVEMEDRLGRGIMAQFEAVGSRRRGCADDFAEKLAGEIVYVQLPSTGKKVKTGKKFATVESGKWLGKVYGPCNGVIVSVNEELETKPGLINEDNYGKGWMYKIKPDDMAELEALIKGAGAIEAWVLADIEKYADKE